MGAVIELNKLKDQIDTNTFDNHNMTVSLIWRVRGAYICIVGHALGFNDYL